jgi:hypothetical protein
MAARSVLAALMSSAPVAIRTSERPTIAVSMTTQ